MSALLQIQGARKRFGPQQVLRGVDLAIEEGRITTLLGKSGSGKTVLLKAIAGLLPLDEGAVLFRDQPIRRHPKDRPPMSYLFQGDALFDSLSAWDNVALPLREGKALSTRSIEGKVAPLLDKLDLGAIGAKYPSELSGGMRRRVALARALVVDPEIVLFDEPTAGLDPIRRNAVLQLIYRDSRRFGFTALVVSHDVPESLFIADAAAILDEGVIAAEGSPEALVSGAVSDSPLHAFLHNKEDLFTRLELTLPEVTWLQDEAAIRREYHTLGIFAFPDDLSQLSLTAQLGHFRHRRQVLDAIRDLGPHVSPAYALPQQRALVGFKGLTPAVTASILFGLPGIFPCAENEAFLRVSLGPSQPDIPLDAQMAILEQAPAQFFQVIPSDS